MKIIHVISRLGGGGAEVVAINLAVQQAKKHNVQIVTLCPKNKDALAVADWQAKILKENSITHVEYNQVNFKLTFPFLSLRLFTLIKKFQPTIVHSHTDFPDIVVSLARRLAKFKIVRTIHNTKVWHTRWLSGYLSESGFTDDLVIAIGKDTALAYSDLRKRYNLRESKHQVQIANGVKVEPETEWLAKSDLVKRFNAQKGNFQVGYFGRLTEQKGVDVLVEAIGKVKAEKVEFHVFGDGEMLKGLSDTAKNKFLPVQFHEPVSCAASVMAAFDIIVIPSRFEGLALVPLEAQLVKAPVLTTDAPGLRETVKPNWPLTVPLEDADALAEMLDEVISGKFDLNLLSLEGLKFAANFSVDKMAKNYEEAYTQYLAYLAVAKND